MTNPNPNPNPYSVPYLFASFAHRARRARRTRRTMGPAKGAAAPPSWCSIPSTLALCGADWPAPWARPRPGSGRCASSMSIYLAIHVYIYLSI